MVLTGRVRKGWCDTALCCALLVSVAAVSAQTQVPADSRLNGIIANKTIRIAFRADARPFSFVNDAKEPLGYTIDLCQQVTKSIAQQVGLPDLKIEWVPVNLRRNSLPSPPARPISNAAPRPSRSVA